MPKLVITGYPSVEGAPGDFKSGAIEYLTKPFTREELKRALDKAFQSILIPIKPSRKNSVAQTNTYPWMIGESGAILNVTNIRGSRKMEKIDVRIVAATNEDIFENVRVKIFREDLYQRLSEVEIDVPPLRQRKSDIPLLVEKFIRKYGIEYRDRFVRITPGALRSAIPGRAISGSWKILSNGHL